jgi:hypothetical protein
VTGGGKMKFVKPIILMFLVCALISTIGSVSATPYIDSQGYWVYPPGNIIPQYHGSLTVDLQLNSSYNDGLAHVGDTVYIYVHPHNTGLSDWKNVVIYAPIPEGLEYESWVMPDRTLQDYDPSTGIWNVDQMLAAGRGSDKELIITCKILPEAAGKTIVIPAGTVKFTSLISVYPTATNSMSRLVDVVASGQAPSYPEDVKLTILPFTGNGPGSGSGNGTGENGPSNGSFNGSGNGTGGVSVLNVTANSKGGIYHAPQSVSLNASGTSEIYYTLNGTDPTTTSTRYEGPINIETSKTLKFIAWNNTVGQSQIYTESYFIYKSVPYSYTKKLHYKKVWYKHWHKKWYKSGEKWKYYWSKWEYYWIYKNKVFWSTKNVLT